MNTNIEVLRVLDELVEAARLLGVTQAKKGFGCHTDEDRRFERAMYESIDKHRAALLDWEANQPAPQQPAVVDGAVDKARFKRAPCYLCGYNGPGYYQPDTHPCAAKYHATQHQEPTT